MRKFYFRLRRARNAWLPDMFAQPDTRFYQQYLFYCDPLERFSIVSLVWGPGQQTPIHDHTVWGLIGMLRGAEGSTSYRLSGGILTQGEPSAVLPNIWA